MSNAYWDQLRAEYQAAQEPALTDENGDEPVIADEDDGWIEWGGGECPVSPETIVEVLLRSESRPGRSWCWDHTNDSSDIIAYRIAQASKDMDGSTEGRAELEPSVGAAATAGGQQCGSPTQHFGNREAGIKPGPSTQIMGESEVSGGHVPAVNVEIKTASTAASQVAHHFLVPPREPAKLPEVSFLPKTDVVEFVRVGKVVSIDGTIISERIQRSLRQQFSPHSFWKP